MTPIHSTSVHYIVIVILSVLQDYESNHVGHVDLARLAKGGNPIKCEYCLAVLLVNINSNLLQGVIRDNYYNRCIRI